MERPSGKIKIVYRIYPIQLVGCELKYYCPFLGCARHPSYKHGMSRSGINVHARSCSRTRLEVPKCTTAERWFEVEAKSVEDEGPSLGGGAYPRAADLSAGLATPRLTTGEKNLQLESFVDFNKDVSNRAGNRVGLGVSLDHPSCVLDIP
jgi:hypothetical protein